MSAAAPTLRQIRAPYVLANARAIKEWVDDIEEDADMLSLVAAVDLLPGNVVYVDAVTGKLALADANVFASAIVAGLAQDVALAGFVAGVATEAIVLDNWTAITGSALLVAGQKYYLGLTPGCLSLVAPTTPGQTVCLVGISASTKILRLRASLPILL